LGGPMACVGFDRPRFESQVVARISVVPVGREEEGQVFSLEVPDMVPNRRMLLQSVPSCKLVLDLNISPIPLGGLPIEPRRRRQMEGQFHVA